MEEELNVQERPIPAEDIQPTEPLEVPKAPTSTVSEMASEIAAEGQAITAESERLRAEEEVQKAEKETEEGRSAILERLGDITGLMRARPELEEKAGVPRLREETAEIASQIEARELSIRRQIERKQKEVGLTKAQVDAQVMDIQRRGASELADLSIVLNAKTRRMDALQTSIDRRISLELEPLKLRLQFEEMFYQQNYESLNTKERNLFEARKVEMDQIYNEEMMKQQQIGQVALAAAQYGANATQIGEIFSSGSFEGAMASGSQFLGAGFALQVDSQQFQQDMQIASQALQRESFQFQKDVFTINQQQAEEQRTLEMIEIYRQMDMDARKEIKDTEEYEEWRVRSRRLEDVNQAAISHLEVDLSTQSPNWETASESDAFVNTVAAALYYTENPTARRPQEMDATEAALYQRSIAKIKKELGGENISPNLLRQQVERLNSLTHASSISLDNQMRAISLEYGVNLETVDGAILSQDKAFLDNLMGGGSNFDLLQLEEQYIYD